ncbi:hypothetical protein EV424DRAFT_1566105 [Suillus variegatus]|nr:hypothetical protein EV424DRAFT_1566105 [Suillus variegatus]
MPPQITYTLYVLRSRRGAATAQPPPLSASGQPVPIIAELLLGPEVMEAEYASEDLRREAMVERPPLRGTIDEFGMDLDVILPEIASPPPWEVPRPPPRPHISRTRSTSSNGSTEDLHSPNSPTTMTAARSPTSPTSPASRPFPGSFSASPPPEPR